MRQWNRQPFYHETLPDGRPNATPLPFVIRDNFLISNYGSGYGVDNDDGSAWFEIFGNVLVGGSGLKSDYSGHDKDWNSNLGIGLGLPCGAFTTYKGGARGQVLEQHVRLTARAHGQGPRQQALGHGDVYV